MLDKDYTFQLKFQVRDYECDMQGVVNHSVYQNYLEHTRHEYLKSVGLDFVRMNEEGIIPHVVRVEIDYKLPLISGDEFISCLNVQLESKIRIVFYQDIYRLSDEKLVTKGVVTGVCLVNGRPRLPESIADLLKK